jgi:hypothetical protein
MSVGEDYYAKWRRRGTGEPDLHFRPPIYCHQIFYTGFIQSVEGSREMLKRTRDLAQLDNCTAWLEVEQRDIEGIEAWLGLTLAQPSLK